MLHAEDNRGHDDSRQGRLGDEGAVGHQEGEADDHQQPRVQAAERSLHTAGKYLQVSPKIIGVAIVEHLELLTAVLEKDPVVGMDWTKEPKMLQSPSATISWLASTDLPPAAGKH